MLPAEHTKRRNRWSVPALLMGCAVALAVVVADMADRHHARAHRVPIVEAHAALTEPRYRDAVPATSISETEVSVATLRDELSWLNEALGSPSRAQRDWLIRHGYTATPSDADLEPAALAHIQAEAIAGHRDAIDQYAALAAMRGQADAQEWLQLSAAHGSTLALVRLAALHQQQQTPESLVTAHAWLLLAKKRGDPLAPKLPTDATSVTESNMISARAAQLYEHLESLRYRQGLAAFDNVPFPTE